MPQLLPPRAARKAVPVTLLTAQEFKTWIKRQPARVTNALQPPSFAAKAGRFGVIRDAQGKVAQVVAILSDPLSMWDLAALPTALPKGVYRLDRKLGMDEEDKLALGWLLGGYRFKRYKSQKGEPVEAQLALSGKADVARIQRMAEAISLVRDLINTPSEDMGPSQLAAAVSTVARKYRAKIKQIVGDDLLKKNYPAIHAVGRASARAPRLIDLTWGNPKNPRVTLVGKGVCFDSGGLDLKPSSGMLQMKKDMAGAATALGVAMLIMASRLPVRLRLLIPAVDNLVAGNSFKPLDVIKMRNGMTVEIGNTDAEGRLILADALAEAVKDKPSMLVDFATLTGAATLALGGQIAALFSNTDKLASEILACGAATDDPLWRMPLFEPYESNLDSPVADMNNTSSSPYGGAITAALFLQKFVGKKQPWAHFDIFASNVKARPGRPEGGEAMALRAVYRLIEKYGTQ